MTAERQQQTPYLDALCAYAERNPARLHVPGHKGGAGADPGMLAAFGERAVSMDIPALTYGIDVGVDPTPFEQAQRLAAEAWGAKRAWFLINGASQGNLAAGLALAHYGGEVVVQRNAHSSAIDALVLSGLRPTFAAPEVDPELGIAHCLTAETLDRALAATPGAVARVGDLADVLRRGGGRRVLARWRTRAACRWSWTRRGARTWPSTSSFPSTRCRWERTS